jgi:flavin-binding protein dodecin
VDLRDDGDSRVVTLAPIELTDLVSDADLQLDQNLDLSAMAYQVIPDRPGVVSDPDPSASPGAAAGPADPATVVLPPIRLVAAHGPADGTPPFFDAPPARTMPIAAKGCPEVSAGDWTFKSCFSGNLSLNVDFRPAAGLKLGVGFVLRADSLHVRSGATIKDGKVTGSSGTIDGIKGFEVHLLGGVANGASDNVKVKLEVPFEIEEAIPPSPATLGLPLNTLVEFKLIVETAFSGKNSTLQADAVYSLDGPVGVEGGTPVAPKLGVVDSILDSLQGITLGPSGLVAAIKWKVQSGIGVPGLVAGPYATLTASVGVSKGSALGSPIADCRTATLSLYAGVGAGVSITSFDKLEAILGKTFLRKAKLETDVNFPIFNASQVQPDLPKCRE